MTTVHETVFEEVRTLIQDILKIPETEITLNTKIADLSEDSIQLFELLIAFEKKYETKTTYEDVIRLQTVGDIVAHVSSVVHSSAAHA